MTDSTMRGTPVQQAREGEEEQDHDNAAAHAGDLGARPLVTAVPVRLRLPRAHASAETGADVRRPSPNSGSALIRLHR